MKNLKEKILGVGSSCNNNCLYCDFFGCKVKNDKTWEDIKNELDRLKKDKFEKIILPCNSDIRKDFLDILRYAKKNGFRIKLMTNGRMFHYREFYDKVSRNVDEFDLILHSTGSEIHDIMTRTPNTIKQTLDGLDNISSHKNFQITIPLSPENVNYLEKTIKSLKDIKTKIRIINPHPLVYRKLELIRKNRNISITDLPKEVKFEITAKCNMDCEFCFNRNSLSRDMQDLPKEEVFAIIEKISQSGIRSLRITGGEPFMRKDIYDILKHAKEWNMFVIVNTNVKLINERDIRKLSTLVDVVLLPCHSKEEIPEKMRIAQVLQKNNITPIINTVLTKGNIRELEHFLGAIEKTDIEWFLARPIPTADNKTPIDNRDIAMTIEKLVSHQGTKRILIESLPFCSYDPDKVRLFSKGSGGCGIFNKMVIDPEGKIKPCYSISVKTGVIGKNEIHDAWRRGLSYETRTMKNMPEACRKCRYLNECLGGCRFAANLLGTSYSDLDPLAQPEKYKDKLMVDENENQK